MAFSRIRVRLDPVPVDGTYRFIHPYGEESIEGVAGDRIFFTDDVGLVPLDFTEALKSRLGPFLLPSNAPGGPELAAVSGPVSDKLYIADPGRSGPVTGSPLPDFTDSMGAQRNHNIFRIEGPFGSNLDGNGNDFIETTDFTLMGRVFQGTIPGRVTVDRASYARNAAGQKLDIFATALPTLAGRLPGQTPSPPVAPQLSFFDVRCGLDLNDNFIAPTGAAETLMTVEGNNQWGQVQPVAIPDSVCVKDNTSQPTPTFIQAAVADEVTISEALYDPAIGDLMVTASSSDELVPPTLTLEDFGVPLVNGQAVVPAVAAPPANVRVSSFARGFDQEQVVTGQSAGSGAGAPVAIGDSIITAEDVPSAAVNLMTNDTNAAGGTITLVQPPTKGSFDAATGVYTPNANANGLDSFTYRVTVGALTSNIATVSVTINPVNDAPVANADSAGTTVGTPIDILLVGNDTDVDGDALSVVNVSTPAGPGTATVTVNGGSVSFSANTAGTYMFIYQASDGTASSAETPVTVTVAGSEVLDAQLAQYRTSRGRWVVSGTSSVPTPHNVTISYADGTSAGFVIGTAVVNALGNWALDIRGARGALDPRTSGATQLNVTSQLGGTDTIGINIRR